VRFQKAGLALMGQNNGRMTATQHQEGNLRPRVLIGARKESDLKGGPSKGHAGKGYTVGPGKKVSNLPSGH